MQNTAERVLLEHGSYGVGSELALVPVRVSMPLQSIRSAHKAPIQLNSCPRSMLTYGCHVPGTLTSPKVHFSTLTVMLVFTGGLKDTTENSRA